jgi:hypothetical protein
MNNNQQILVILVALLATFGNLLAITLTLNIAIAQDQNPPTTGKTNQNVTSSFGPNLPPSISVNNNITDGHGTQNTLTK